MEVRIKNLFIVLACLRLFLLAHAVNAQQQVSDACWSGTWVGTYATTNSGGNCTWVSSGNITWTLNVTNGVVSGSGSEDGFPCISETDCTINGYETISGPLSGTVSSTTIYLQGDWPSYCNGQKDNNKSFTATISYSPSGCMLIGGHETLQKQDSCDSCMSTITGNIYCTCDGSPITGASVQIESFSATSASDGSYSISGIPSGTYSVTVSQANYYTTNTTITIPSGSSTVTNDFMLTPLPGLDYFGVGVNWANVNPPGSCSLRGDIGATELYYHLRSDLSSVCKPGTVVTLDAAATSISNLNAIITQFYQFTNNVCPNDTVVFYVDCHAGDAGTDGIQISLASDYDNNPVFDGITIADMLDSLPTSTRKIVILDMCHSGGIAEELVDFVPNTAALAACAATQVAQFVCSAGSNDGISIFTSAIMTNLDNGIFDLHQIAANITADAFGVYESDIGQNLNLEDTGSAIFTGLQPQHWASSGFTGNLTNSVVSVVQPPPVVTMPMTMNGVFQMTLTNMPTEGSIAIELSTNLISWLQVVFNPAAGTNLTFSFPMTNNTAAFFRTVLVP